MILNKKKLFFLKKDRQRRRLQWPISSQVLDYNLNMAKKTEDSTQAFN
jgi:hypothetical protein